MAKMIKTLLCLISALVVLYCDKQVQYSGLECLPGVDRFSSGLSLQHYYQCDKSIDQIPVLAECPNGQRYGRKVQECVDDNGPSEPEYITEKSLGRNAQLGVFYDARTQMFFPETSLWKRQTILSSLERYEDYIHEDSVTLDTRAKDKLEHLDIKADLTLGFMGGFIKLHGTFGYIIDKVTVDNEVNAALSYSTNYMRQVLPKNTPVDYTEECDNPDVTHVVSRVTYGMGAFFNFKKLLSENEERSAIEAALSASIKIIPGISVGGDIDGYLNETYIEILNSTSLHMFGDFSPSEPNQRLPTTFEEAVEFFQLIPMFAGPAEENWPGSTITEVRMTPIQEYCENSGNLVEEISEALKKELINMFDCFDQLEMKSGGILAQEPAVVYQPIRENLHLYKTALESYRLRKQKQLQEILPEILGDPHLGEEGLVEMHNEYLNSQFVFGVSDDFLVNRNREVRAVQYFMDMFPQESNIAIADYEMGNDIEFIFKKEKVVILDFNILTPKSMTQGFLDGVPEDESNFWFNDESTTGHMGSILKDFSSFALANVNQEDRGYLLKLSLIDPDKLFSMNALVKGEIISNEFMLPPQLSTPSHSNLFGVDAISHDRFQFKIPRGNQFITGCLVSVSDNVPDPQVNGSLIVREIVHIFKDDLLDQNVEVTVFNLSPAHLYSFNVRYLTDVGSGAPSEESQPFFTSAVSPPTAVSAGPATTNMIHLSWASPNIIAEYLGFNKSIISYRINIDGQEIITDEFETNVKNLKPGLQYPVEVRAFISEKFTGNFTLPDSSPSKILAWTAPAPPVNLQYSSDDVGEHSIDLSWSLADSQNISEALYYLVNYCSEGGTVEQYVAEHTKIKITNLARGTVYTFSVQVVTLGGISELSEEVLVETKFIPTELEKIQDEFSDFLGNFESKASAKSSFCSFSSSTNERVITYDSVLTSDNNIGGAVMNPSTGSFIVGISGSYKLMANMEMKLWVGQHHTVEVMVNGKSMKSLVMTASNDINNFGLVSDQGSFNTVLMLREGDIVNLEHETNGDETLHSVTFCVELIQIEE